MVNQNAHLMESTSKKTIIFPHIPKCGGTSLHTQFKESELAVYFDYDAPPSERKWFKEQCRIRNENCQLLDFSKFDLIFGHFPINRYENSIYRYVSLLRHPVERAISHYFYWKYQLPESNLLALHNHPIIQEIKSGKVPFLDFLERSQIQHFYPLFIQDKRPCDFILVGFTDKYKKFCNDLSGIVEFSVDSTICLRKRGGGGISSADFDQAENLLSDEMERYQSFRQYWV